MQLDSNLPEVPESMWARLLCSAWCRWGSTRLGSCCLLPFWRPTKKNGMNHFSWRCYLFNKSNVYWLFTDSLTRKRFYRETGLDYYNTFSSPELRSFWTATEIESPGFVQHRKSVIHELPVKSGKSVRLRIWNEYSAHAQKIGSGQSSRSPPQVRRIVALGTRTTTIQNDKSIFCLWLSRNSHSLVCDVLNLSKPFSFIVRTWRSWTELLFSTTKYWMHHFRPKSNAVLYMSSCSPSLAFDSAQVRCGLTVVCSEWSGIWMSAKLEITLFYAFVVNTKPFS